MQDQIDNMEVKIDKMYDALVGTELNPNVLIKRVESTEKYISKSKKQKWIAAGVLATLGTIGKFWDKIVQIF